MKELTQAEIEVVSGGRSLAGDIVVGALGSALFEGVKAYAGWLANTGRSNVGMHMTPEMTAINGGNMGA
ncbi:hypothetical protein [Rugamonas rivuli]|uniref:Uncharacterized protein n=1 Tax=Rugamonas rivuli TaxID=2743358 RepID=A0A843SGV1_9BURK|nr:hypothetical protein [Rugamonas rivuli]MQA21688.1 hypothetical protein [Rugamonas rivuli]